MVFEAVKSLIHFQVSFISAACFAIQPSLFALLASHLFSLPSPPAIRYKFAHNVPL
jgi:hypothetical protein